MLKGWRSVYLSSTEDAKMCPHIMEEVEGQESILFNLNTVCKSANPINEG
jgi:hypothetical protein